MATNVPHQLDQVGEWAGVWWLPDESEQQIPGILRYDGQGNLELSLIGAFEDRIYSNPAPGVTIYHEGTRTWDVIHGVAERREVTLLSCVPTSTKRTMFARVASPDRQTVSATMAVIGAHVRGDDDPAFESVEVSLEDLGLWAGSSAIEGSFGTSNGKMVEGASVSMRPIAAQTVTVDGTAFELEHRHTVSFFDQRKGETVGRMRDTASIRAHRDPPFTLSTALETTGMVRDLIALAMHRAVGVIWVQVEVAGTESVLPDGQILPRRRADVLYSPLPLGRHDAKAIDRHRVLFTTEDLPFRDVIPRWCGVYDRLRTAINMIMGLRYSPGMFVESNLLTAVGAAEVLHRGLGIGGRPFPKGTFRKMRDEMLHQVPDEDRDRFRQMIRNDLTLRERLCALAGRLDPEAIAQLVPDIDYWAERTTSARNELAHEGRTVRHSFDELIAIVDTTTAVVLLNVLHELGLSGQRQREIVREVPQLRETCRKARQWLTAPGPIL